MNRGELIHLLLFLLALALSYYRSNLPSFKEREIYVKGTIVGDILREPGYTLTRIKIEESEIEEIEDRKATLKVYGYLPVEAKEIALIGDVSVINNRIFLYAKGNDIDILTPERTLRDVLMDRYVRISGDKYITHLGLAFLFGQPRELLPSDVQRNFLNTGLVHLLVVSGLHVGTVALVLSKMLPRFQGMKLALIGIVFYTVFIVPHEPPVLRASIMLSLILLSLLTFRRPNTLAILFFSGTAILLAYPHYVFSYSFWLSFVATAYIILAIKNLEANTKVKTLVASASAFTGVAPLISTFSGISPLSVIFTPLLSPVVLLYSLFGVLSLLTLMSFPPFIDMFNLVGTVFESAVGLASHFSFKLYPQVGFYEAVLLTFAGGVSLYLLKGYSKLIPIALINLWLLFRAL